MTHMPRVLVSGAFGYIGRHVVECLAKKGAEVFAIDMVRGNARDDVNVLIGDVLHNRSFVESLPSVDVVLHLAWQDGFKHNAPSHLANLNAHFEFLTAMARKGVKRLAVMGSMHEVGYWEGAITADTPCNPLSLYGIAKNALRQTLLVALKDSDVKLQWLRGFYVCGDDRCNHSVFTKLLEAADAGKQTFPFTSGRNLYDFTRVDDLADMIATTVLQDKINGIVNCCTGMPKSLATAVEEFISANHLDIRLAYGAFPDRPYDSPGVWGDPTLINQIMQETVI